MKEDVTKYASRIWEKALKTKPRIVCFRGIWYTRKRFGKWKKSLTLND